MSSYDHKIEEQNQQEFDIFSYDLSVTQLKFDLTLTFY